jgi:2'-5' RNA ligase
LIVKIRRMKKEKEYFIIISPPDEIQYFINKCKRACAKYIGRYESMSSKAHISFAKYLDEENDMGQMSDIMHRFIQIVEFEINQTESFEMEIEGFDFFTHGSDYKTIYAALKLSDEFMTWFNNIRKKLFIEKNIKPHITIAKKISNESFTTLWPHFQKLSYKKSFKPECLTILSREADKPFVAYQKFKEITFIN